MTARVSVVVPSHNHGHLLAEALNSIDAQGIADLEVIVVDDRSTDDTAELATARGLRVVTSSTPGAAAARNAGVSASTGAHLAFLDADDLWTPGSLAARLAALEPGIDATYGAIEEFVDELATGDHPQPRTVGPTRVAGTMLLTRTAWERVGVLDESLTIGEFIDWVGRFDAAGLVATALPEVVLRRRIHNANTTRTASATAAGYLEVARLHRRRKTT